jgi:hypothetical protein
MQYRDQWMMKCFTSRPTKLISVWESGYEIELPNLLICKDIDTLPQIYLSMKIYDTFLGLKNECLLRKIPPKHNLSSNRYLRVAMLYAVVTVIR